MKIAVIGLGTFGKAVALRLGRGGAEVIAIDTNLDLVEDVKNDVGLAVKLDATDERDLRSQEVDRVDVLVAAIGNFEANELVVVLAKRFGIRRVIAMARSDVHARILKLIGADDVVQPEEEAADKVSQTLLLPDLKSYFELIEGYSIAELSAPPAFHGRTVADLDLRKRFAVNLVAVKRQAGKGMTVNPVPLPGDAIQPGDILAVAGSDASIRRMLREAGQA